MTTEPVTIEPPLPMAPDQAKTAMEQFQALTAAMLGAEDRQQISADRKFVKRSGGGRSRSATRCPARSSSSTSPATTTAPRPRAGGRSVKEALVLELVLQGIVGLAAFAVLYMIGLIVLRAGGGDDTKDIGLD